MNADAENTLSAALDELLDQFDKDTWEKYSKKAKLLRPNFDANESRVEDDPEEISRREKTLTKVLNKVLGMKGNLGNWEEGQRIMDNLAPFNLIKTSRKNQLLKPSYREKILLSKQLSFQVLTVQI